MAAELRWMIVPTLCVGMPQWTLRVCFGTRSVPGCISTQSVGTIGSDQCGNSLLAMGPEQSINSLTFPKRQIHRQPSIHRRLSSLGEHPLQQLHLLTPQ